MWQGELETDDLINRERRGWVGGTDREDGRVRSRLEGASVRLGKRLPWALHSGVRFLPQSYCHCRRVPPSSVPLGSVSVAYY